MQCNKDNCFLSPRPTSYTFLRGGPIGQQHLPKLGQKWHSVQKLLAKICSKIPAQNVGVTEQHLWYHSLFACALAHCTNWLVKLIPSVNFTNILWAAIVPKSFCQKITNPNCEHIKACKKLSYKNLLANGLAKLIPGVQHEGRQDRQTGSWPSDRKLKTGNASSHRRPPGFSRRNSRSNYHHCLLLSLINLLTTAVSWNWAGSVISNGREPRSCLGWVFNIKLGSLVSKQLNCMAHTHSHF